MSLMDVLAKVATEMAAAKGASGTMNNPASRQNNGGLFGNAPASDAAAEGGPGLESLIGGLLGGNGGANSGLGGLLESLTSGASSQSNQSGASLDDAISKADNSGGLGGLLEQLTAGQGGGGLGDLLGKLTQSAGASAGTGGNFGDILNQALAPRSKPKQQPTKSQEAAAGLMLKAMIQAAKSDGKIDEGERSKLLEKLGDVSAAEREFVNKEMAAPMDVQGLARQVPRGLENQVYAMSVLGINLDDAAEAKYLDQFASHLRIEKDVVNSIHDKFGVQRLYR
ncbi:MAG: tellurite resistance TerB family protein [Alphaproteobacteria bacterium]|nr:tellurite resistance TerB family protein [Alphaproteobacteria bacterium]